MLLLKMVTKFEDSKILEQKTRLCDFLKMVKTLVTCFSQKTLVLESDGASSTVVNRP